MIDLSSLNPEQKAAVTAFSGPMLILAGAGTGKTRVITYRIGHMLDSRVPPSEIVALSFTNKAAREMAERVRHLAGERASDVWLGTFHSFCLHLLRRFAGQAGLPPRFGLIGTGDQVDLVRKGLAEKKWDGLYNAEQLLAAISRAKNALLTPKAIREGEWQAGDADKAMLAEVYDLYERQLALNRVIDFDDCIFRCTRLLSENPDVRAKLRAEFRYFLVDEFQDTNAAQLKVLELLASDDHDVCVVGDDDQSIYSWRGAVYEILEKFEALFPGTQVVKLEQNYRCTSVILDAANEVIRHNARRKDKSLWSKKQAESLIEVSPRLDEKDEAEWISSKIIGFLGAGAKPSDVGILYRANAQARPIELALREARIPYKTFGGQSFFERKEVKDFLGYLRLLLNPDDHLALWRIINTPNRGIGLKTLERIEERAREKRQPPFQLIRSDVSFLDARSQAAVQSFVRMIDSLGELPLESQAHYESLGLAILKESGLIDELRSKSKDVAARERKIENLKTLPAWLAQVAGDATLRQGGVPSKDAFLDIITLDNDKRDKQEEGGHYVSLMTIHAAKGLEFRHVFVIGVEEEQLPHRGSVSDPQAICEERRLFYVAITRAKDKLHISYCGERSGIGGKSSREPSRFLTELPEAALKHDSEANTKPEEVKDRRKAGTLGALSKLRANLSTGKW